MTGFVVQGHIAIQHYSLIESYFNIILKTTTNLSELKTIFTQTLFTCPVQQVGNIQKLNKVIKH